ncbi:DUF3275 family protein [Azoarcus olearius]|uniref:DUF3275 family protein n=1 Tax=Azoarcus sp. (strain BH72) TaxID=418699 RepID=A1K749_AZOSB|nr:DUF3275 family protein [Azoarcus olearius]CAL94654.1 conserved hypothetical protein [Azoarcus olearius]
MSVTVEGSLRIKRIQGANGPFCVGDLLTEIGEFRVKDPVLDQFEEGVYTGRYIIQRIFSWSYTSNGRLVVEIRARLADLQIDDGTESTVPDAPAEPDPADEQSQPAEEGAESPAVAREDDKPAETASAPVADASPDRRLFGDELYALVVERKPVKLDPAIDDRKRFREQRNRLKSGLDYAFVPEEQTWYPAESEQYQAYLAGKSEA